MIRTENVGSDIFIRNSYDAISMGTLYIKCKKCGTRMSTGISAPPGQILRDNVAGPCPNPNCRATTTWSGADAFFEDGTPYEA